MTAMEPGGLQCCLGHQVGRPINRDPSAPSTSTQLTNQSQPDKGKSSAGGFIVLDDHGVTMSIQWDPNVHPIRVQRPTPGRARILEAIDDPSVDAQLQATSSGCTGQAGLHRHVNNAAFVAHSQSTA